MTETELILKAYEIIGKHTPLRSDCGRLCSAACCAGDDDMGMLLFPGEESLYEDSRYLTKTDYGMPLLLCKGVCDRELRPLACRIFPLAIVNQNGAMRVIADPRSRAICPLYKKALEGRLDPEFIKAVRNAGKVIFESEKIKEFTAIIFEQCREFAGL